MDEPCRNNCFNTCYTTIAFAGAEAGSGSRDRFLRRSIFEVRVLYGVTPIRAPLMVNAPTTSLSFAYYSREVA